MEDSDNQVRITMLKDGLQNLVRDPLLQTVFGKVFQITNSYFMYQYLVSFFFFNSLLHSSPEQDYCLRLLTNRKKM